MTEQYDVSVVKCGSYEENEIYTALNEAIGSVGGLDWITPGMTIAIKTNLVAAMSPDSAAISHPAVIREAARIFTEHGAKVVIGDCPGGPFIPSVLKHTYSVSQLDQIQLPDVELNSDFNQSAVVYPDAKVAKTFDCADYLLKADAIVDICKLKTHGMMNLSCACKNFYGIIPGVLKTEYHFRFSKTEDFANMLVDLCEYMKPRLCICDAVFGMEGNGPTAGTPRKIGALLCSPSAHILDCVASDLIGLNRTDVPTIKAAHERGLIPQSFTVYGNPDELTVSDYKLVHENNSFLFNPNTTNVFSKALRKLLNKALSTRPEVGNTCIGCGKCASVCPAKAITIINKKASIDRNHCIKCFCCQEFCPVGAMKVKRALTAKLIHNKNN